MTIGLVRKAASVAAFLGAALMGLSAQAATIDGSIEIAGAIEFETVDDVAGVDFKGDGFVLDAVGDFAALVGELVTLTDVVFAAPGEIWSVGGFSFVAASFRDITENLQGGIDFTASGSLFDAGDETPGVFFFSSQAGTATASFSSTTETSPIPVPGAGLLLLTALGGVAVARRRANA
ncbi:MAG: hypothetical protein AAGF74_02120 [Pseudomonadota bacterium]